MKKSLLLFALILTSFMYEAADAQVNIGINIGNQPVWGPAGYDYAQYYYFPDIDVYYNVPEREFVYFDGRNWVSDYALPAFYGNFDLYNSYKVVINENNPYLRNDYWHSRYYGYRGHAQQNIYSSRDPRYFVIKDHPMHDRWMGDRQNDVYDRGRGYDNRQGNFGRNDDWRSNNNQRPGMGRFDDRRFDNNQRPEMQRNDNRRSDDFRRQPEMNRDNHYDNAARQNDDRRGNDWHNGRRF